MPEHSKFEAEHLDHQTSGRHSKVSFLGFWTDTYS